MPRQAVTAGVNRLICTLRNVREYGRWKPTMKLVTEYLEQVVVFENMAV